MRPLGLFVPLGLVSALAAAADAGEVRGRLVYRGQPVNGVTVSAVACETPFEAGRREARSLPRPADLARVVTRSDGSFALTMTAPAAAPRTPIRLKLSGGGVPEGLLSSVFEASDDRDLGEIQVGRSGVLSGRVQGPDGVPIPGAMVTVWPGGARLPFGFDSPFEPLPSSVTTGADGTFKLDHVEEVGNRIRVEAAGFAPMEREARQGAVRVPFVLSPGRPLDGVVLRADRRTPAAGTLVRFQGSATSRWVEAAADGTFRIDGVAGAEGQIVAESGDGGGATAPPPTTGKATLVLAPLGTLAGRVVDAKRGTPVADLLVLSRGAGRLHVARSGADGRYVVSGLPAQPYRLSVDDPRYVPWSSEEVRLATGATASRDIALTAAATLTGRVVDESGAPIAGARGTISSSRVRDFQAMMRQLTRSGPAAFQSGADGRFRAASLPPGDGHTLTVSHSDYEPRSLGVTLRPGAANPPLTVTLRRGLGLTGVVKDQEDRPLAGVEMSLFRNMSMQSRRGNMSFTMGGVGQIPPQTSDAAGRFSFRGLAAGHYSLSAKKAGYGQKRVDPVTVAETPAAEPLELVLSPGATISGVVRDNSGKGVEGLRVLVRASTGGAPGMMVFPDEPTAPDGSFTLENLGAGETYDLQLVTATGGGPQKTGVVAPAEGIVFTTSALGGFAGTVTEADGERPISRYTVTYRQPPGSMGMMFSFGPGARGGVGVPVSVEAGDGKFRISEVPAGTWSVEVKAEGYLDGHVSPVVVDEGRVTEGVEVRLERGVSLSGRVLEADSARPVVDALVRARLQGDPRGGFSFPIDEGGLRATTDADGRFVIAGLARGAYSVSASHPDYSEATESVGVKEQAVSLDLRLGRGLSLAGGVLSGGRPVAGATVDVNAAGDDRVSGFMGNNLLTGENGRFRFDHLAPGRYTVTAALRNDASPPLEVVLQAGQSREDLVLNLGAGATLRGVVLGLAEEALVGLSVNASGPDGFQGHTRTTAGGRFEITGAPPGTIAVHVMAGDFMRATRTAAAQVTVAEGQAEVNVEVRFEEGFRLSGHVTRGGEPLADMRVGAYAEAGGRSGASTHSDAEGGYVLEGLAEGAYHVFAHAPAGGSLRIQRKVTISADTTLDLDAPLARVAGTVVEAETRRPLADASLWLEGEMGVQATTDSSGRFLFDSLEPRSYKLGARKPGYQSASVEVSASEEGDVIVELRRGEGLAIVGRDGVYGTPLRSLDVRVRGADGVTAFGGSVTLDGEGRGEIPALKAGVYELRASSSEYAPVILPTLTVPTAAAITLALTPGGRLDIQCGPETLGRPQATARLLTAGGQVYPPWIFSDDGVITLGLAVRRFQNVAPGRYTLAVAGGPSHEVEIREGETATVTLP